MKKNLLIFLSHNFCTNCCGDAKKLDCDSRNTTCDKLANFLVGCNLYKEEINEDELDELAMSYCEQIVEKEVVDLDKDECVDSYNGFKAGYCKAMEVKQ